MAKERQIRKILFVTLTNIGDVVLTLPSLDYLKNKFKEAEFTVLSGQNASVLFSNDIKIKENISYDKHAPFRQKFALFKRLRKEGFDVIIDLRDTAFRWLAPAKFKNPYIIRIPRGIRHLRYKHLYKTLAAFKETAGIKNIQIPVMSICLDGKTIDSTDSLLKRYQLTRESDYIVVAPGARSKTKRWHKEGFVKICNELLKHYSVVLLGDKSDSAIAQDINRELDNRCIDLTGQTKLLEAIAILRNAKLVICNDSAILQIASYLNKPTLAIFGPTDENKYGPLSPISTVVRKNTLCTPCEGDNCTHHWQCMRGVSPQLVIDYAYSLLNNKVPQSPLPYRRILISRTDRLGDVLLSTPVISNLRNNLPSAYIAMMVKESLQDLIKGNPYLDEVIPFDKRGRQKGLINSIRFAMELTKKNFDLALILHPQVRVHLILFFAGIKERIGYDRKWGFLNTRILKHTKQIGEKHEAEYALEFLKELRIQNYDTNMFMPTYKESEGWVNNLFLERKLRENKVVTVHCQASCPSKLWPRKYFDLLIRNIINIYNANIIYTGEEVDSKIQEDKKTVNLTGKTSLSQLASILKRSNLFISNDSGPVHMAVALGTPVISIFGRKQAGLGPKRWRPLGKKSVFLQKDAGCQVCLAHDCKRDFSCLKAIDPKEVLFYVDKFLS